MNQIKQKSAQDLIYEVSIKIDCCDPSHQLSEILLTFLQAAIIVDNKLRTTRYKIIMLKNLSAIPLLLTIALCPPAVLHAASAALDSAPVTTELPFFRSAGGAAIVKGSFATQYAIRVAGVSGNRDTDNDLHERLRLDVYSPQRDTGYELHFFAAASQDLDGDRNRTGFFPLEDINDARDSWFSGYVYEAHYDLNRPAPYVTQLRIGRQAGTRDEPVFFDGIAADLALGSLMNMTAYGGASVHFYEIDQDWGSDLLGGAGIDLHPFRSTMLSLDYLHAEDERNLVGTSDQADELLSLRLRQRLGLFTRTMVAYRSLNGEPRDVKARLLQSFPSADLELSFTWFRQFREQNELSNELSPYFDILGSSFPYQTYDAKIRKAFGSHVAVDLGYYKRELLKERVENAFNREYERAFAVLQFSDIVKKGLSFSLTGDWWETLDREFTSAGFDAEYRFGKDRKKTRLNAGTYYSLYKFDYYILLGEREKVRTYYVKGGTPLTTSISLDISYEYEDSIENYSVARMGMRYDF